jgi:hypothetical protein
MPLTHRKRSPLSLREKVFIREETRFSLSPWERVGVRGRVEVFHS